MRLFALIAAIHGACGVAAGAFAAHMLSSRLEPKMLAAFETGARYQLLHAIALLALSAWAPSTKAGQVAGWGFAVGALLFTGSLYGLALGGPKILGPITPLGGTLLIVGWIALGVAAFHR